MSKRAHAVWVLLGFSCLAVFATFPLVRVLTDHLPSDLGDPLLTAWTLAWDADRMRHGFAHIWDAPNFYPYKHTLLYSDHLLGIALFTAPIQWITGNPILVYNLAFVGSYILSGVGMYVLAYELTGRRDAAAIAGTLYACQPFRALHLSHLQWLMTGWLPLSLWALHRYFATRRLRHLIATTIFYLLQSLTAAYFTYFALVPIVVVAVAELLRTRVSLRIVAGHLIPAAALTLAVLAPIVMAYYELRVQSGLHRTDDEIRNQSADVAGYFSPPPNVRLWSGRSAIRGEREVFPGTVAFVLAVAAIGVRSDRRTVSTYSAVLAVAFVLSLGPEPMAWNHRLGIQGPYGWLLRVVPGLDGLRVPARLALVVQMAFAVLAAVGYARLSDRLSSRPRRVAFAVAIVAIFADGWAGPIDTPAFGPRGRDYEQAAYDYVRRLPTGAVLELPTSIDDPTREFPYQYMTIVHGHPVVNGHSGYVTPLVIWLGGGHSPFREPDQQRDGLELARGLGVRYVLVHRGSYADDALAAAMIAAIQSDGAPVVEHRTFGNITVAVLTPLDRPAAPDRLTEVPRDRIQARASHGNDRVPLMFDGDRDTRWISGGPQSGTEQLDLTLDRPRDVRIIRLQLGARSFGDYPRELAIDAIEDATSREVFHGSVLPELARGIVADGDYPFVDIVLPPNHARALRLRQLRSTRVFFWSVHELYLLEHFGT